MKDFRKQNGQGGGRNEGFERREQSNDFRGPRRDFDNRGGENKFKGSRADGSMHKAICSECGRPCEVPFAPSGNKPVYCSDCFGKKKGSHSGGYEKRDFAPRGPVAHEARPQTQTQTQPQQRDTRIDDLKAQVDAINTKLDRMMKVLLEATPAQKMVSAVVKEEKKFVLGTKKVVAKVKAKVAAKTTPKKKK